MRPARSASVLAEFHLRSIWNWRTIYYGKLIEPIAYYIFLVAGLNVLVKHVLWRGMTIDYSDFALPGVFALVGLRIAFIAMIDAANDRKWGVYALARMSGSTATAYTGSLVVAALVVALAQIVIVGACAIIVSGTALTLTLRVMLAAVPVVIFWILAGIAIGMLVNSYHKRDLVSSLVPLPLALTAPVFFVATGLPGYMRVLMLLNPLTYHVEFLRAAAFGGWRWYDVVVPLAGFVVVVGLLGRFSRRVEWLSTEVG